MIKVVVIFSFRKLIFLNHHVFWRNIVWNRKSHSTMLNGIIWEFCKFCRLTYIVDSKQTRAHFPNQSLVLAPTSPLHTSYFSQGFYSKIRYYNYMNFNGSNNDVFCFFKISAWNFILPLQKDYVCRLLSHRHLSTQSSWIHFPVITTYLEEIMASLRLLFSCTLGSISKYEGTLAEGMRASIRLFLSL